MFYGSGDGTNGGYTDRAWTKPAGVSQIYMMLIGGGATGDGSTTGGSSGNVTTWFGAAQNVPDSLIIRPAVAISVANDGFPSYVMYRGTSLNTLLAASGGRLDGIAPTANTANAFGNSGFYQSVQGQAGSVGAITASETTFLSAGGDGSNTTTANYGYSLTTNKNGFFMLQPIIVACASSATIGNTNQPFGCGSSVSSARAGPGFVLIASW